MIDETIPQRAGGRRRLLLAAAAFLLLLADGACVRAGLLRAIDARLLLAWRVPGRLDTTVAPEWLDALLRDASLVGRGPALTLVVLVAMILFATRRAPSGALLLGLATASGALVERALKLIAHRVRPEVVPHLVAERTLSFPSAHAADSALVLLMIAGLVAQRARSAWIARLSIAGALAASATIGVSRVYLGVHWPSDVLAGWSLGAGWAWLSLGLYERVRSRVRRDGSPA